MGYNPPIRETETAKIFVHNNASIAPDNAFIVAPKSEEDTTSFLENAKVSEVRDVFNAVASLKNGNEEKFILFHAIRPGDEVQHTNSKLPHMHIHVYTGDFSAEYSQVSDPAVKSYAVKPNADLASVIKRKTKPDQDFQKIKLNKNNGGEAENHEVLVCRKFKNFDDFVKKATEADFEAFREHMLDIIRPNTQLGQGGVRIVIDDRNLKTGVFVSQFLSGENLDRSGQKSQRYFEKPKLK